MRGPGEVRVGEGAGPACALGVGLADGGRRNRRDVSSGTSTSLGEPVGRSVNGFPARMPASGWRRDPLAGPSGGYRGDPVAGVSGRCRIRGHRGPARRPGSRESCPREEATPARGNPRETTDERAPGGPKAFLTACARPQPGVRVVAGCLDEQVSSSRSESWCSRSSLFPGGTASAIDPCRTAACRAGGTFRGGTCFHPTTRSPASRRPSPSPSPRPLSIHSLARGALWRGHPLDGARARIGSMPASRAQAKRLAAPDALRPSRARGRSRRPPGTPRRPSRPAPDACSRAGRSTS